MSPGFKDLIFTRFPLALEENLDHTVPGLPLHLTVCINYFFTYPLSVLPNGEKRERRHSKRSTRMGLKLRTTALRAEFSAQGAPHDSPFVCFLLYSEIG